jgi:hypothetical protein
MLAHEVVLALKHVWATLESLNVPMAVMGGVALSAWKYPRATQDVDLLIGLEGKDPDFIVQKLAAAKFRAKRQPPVLTLGQLRIVQVLYEPPGTFLDLQIDLLLADCEYQRQALSRRTVVNLPDLDIAVAVLSCEDLVLHKVLAGRIVDRADAAKLLRANRTSLDFDYLRQWSGKLNLSKELKEIWTEAFPGESLPFA